MSGKLGMRRYPLEERLEVVKKHLEEGVSTRILMEEYGIASKTQIEGWCRKYRETGEVVSRGKKLGRPKKGPETDKEKIARLEMEIELLKKYREELRR